MRATARPLGGGVSSVVIDVAAGHDRLVVKQPRARLAVQSEWLASPTRARNEAAALQYIAVILPGQVPTVITLDERRMAFAMTAAPETARNWKAELMSGTVDLKTAERVGHFLGAMHAASSADPECPVRFGDREVFSQLRIDPYYNTLLESHPDLIGPIGAMLARMHSTQSALVHGDFTPKNILVLDEGIWVIDWEICHFGDPIFDVASVLGHLLLKAIHRPSVADDYLDACRRLLGSYVQHAPLRDWPYLMQQTACFMLARVDGKSPAEYLTDDERQRTRQLTLRTLTERPGGIEEYLKETDDRG